MLVLGERWDLAWLRGEEPPWNMHRPRREFKRLFLEHSASKDSDGRRAGCRLQKMGERAVSLENEQEIVA